LRGFDMRGGLLAASPAHLVHPAGLDTQALAATRDFLSRLGCAVTIAADPIAPMLIKNQPER
jgi:hypothetical protein